MGETSYMNGIFRNAKNGGNRIKALVKYVRTNKNGDQEERYKL